MSDNSDLLIYQAWCSEQQGVIDTLHADKQELQKRVTQLETQLATLTSMVERLQVALSQGGTA